MGSWESKVGPLVEWLKTDREAILEAEHDLAKFVPGFTLDLATMESRDRNWHHRRLVKDKKAEADTFEGVTPPPTGIL